MNQFNTSLTIPELLQQRSKESRSKCSLRFLHNGTRETDNLTFEQMMHWSNDMAIGLSKVTKPGDSVILSFPAGLAFIASFYACLMVGAIAVPIAHPSKRKNHWERVKGIANDCDAKLILTDESTVSFAAENLDKSNYPPITGLSQLDTTGELLEYHITSTDIAYLQYTSGSTSAPKGVIMTHQNVIHNVTAIANGFSLDDSDVIVSWLPHHHDQGLVGIILLGLWLGIPVTLMAPVAFLQNPFYWLHAISRYRATYSGGPNFGFSFCVEKHTEEKCKDLDLSSWKVAFNGAEPVRSDTLNDFAQVFSKVGFSAQALAPCYGLAEATLAVSLTPTNTNYLTIKVDKAQLEHRQWLLSNKGIELVSSGEIIGQQTVVIVDPKRLQESQPNQIGEIWVAGPSVAMGYWKNPQQTARSMGLSLPNHPNKTFLRSGDLGYIHNGELFVAGRIKDVIIIRGRNHYPQDIELTVNQASNAFRQSGCAAFACDINQSPQLIVVQEIERVAIRKFNPTETRRLVTEQIALHHDLKVHKIIFIRPITLPKTSSGKVQRSRAKQKYMDETLSTINEQKLTNNTLNLPKGQSTLGNIINEMVDEPIDLNASLLSLGLDSIELIRFKQTVESRLSIILPLDVLFENHSVAQLETRLDQFQKSAKLISIPELKELDHTLMAENQKSLWLAQRLQADSGVFNLAVPFVLHDTFNKNTLNSVWLTCLERHPLLTMSIKNTDESVKFIATQRHNKITFHDENHIWNTTEISKKIRALAQTAPCLDEPKLTALHCWPQSSSTQVLCFIIHHVLVDMWSLLNVLDEFLQLVSGNAISGKSASDQSLSDKPLPYSEHVAQSHKNLHKNQNSLNYWKEKFQHNTPPILRLPGNAMRPQKRLGHANSTYFTITNQQALKKIAKEQGITLHGLLLGIYAMVMMRFSGQSEITIGGPTFGREDARFDTTVGFFVNTVVYQLKQEFDAPFDTFIKKVADETRNVIQHQHTPFSEVVKNTNILTPAGTHPLYQTSFMLQKSHRLVEATPMIINGPHSQMFTVYGQKVSTFPMPAHSCQVDIALTMVDSKGALQGRLDFATDVLKKPIAKQIASSIEQVICQLPQYISSNTGSIPIQKTESPLTESSVIEHFHEFVSVNQCLHKSMHRYAEHDAFIFNNRTFTYQQLEQWSTQMAGQLKKLNVSQGDVVALACSRSPYWVSCMLAIWQVGAIYVPIDDNLPEHRAINILDQISALLVVVEDDRLEFLNQKVELKTLLKEKDKETDKQTTRAVISSNDPAYILFTSGTTGVPKGVMVNHGSLSNRLGWLSNNIPLKCDERVLHKTPISFDVSLWESLWPLYSGAVSVIADDIERKNPVKLADLMRTQKVSTVQFVPSFLSVFINFVKTDWPRTLTRIISGGEELTSDIVEKLDLKSIDLHNLYGPTESGFVTHQKIQKTTDALTLGASICNTKVMILDSDNRPVPIGAIGELVVFGQAVGLGYLNQTDQQNSFGVTNDQMRYYRTGDMAEYTETGQIKFLGRADRQVKLRGFRVELSDIESVLSKHPEVIASHCSIVGQEALGQLFAWVHSANADINEALVVWCKKHLPIYMNPDHIVVLDHWSLTEHGKFNTQLLPKNIISDADKNTPPKDQLEEDIAKIWASLLNYNSIHRQTHFFASGGHSLLAAIMASRIKEKFGITPDIQLIFREPLLKNYAQALIDFSPTHFTAIDDDEKEEFVI